MRQCLNMLAVHEHGRGKRLGTCLVLESRALCFVSLQHVPMFEYASCARAWMRHTPRYMSSVCCVCCGHCCMDGYIWKILGCCSNTKRHCRNAHYCRNIAAIPCSGHCRNVAATLQLRLHCCSIAAIPRCRNIAAMGPLLQYAVRIAAIRNASTHCRNIAAMTCCRNIAAMPWGIADYLKSTTYPPPCIQSLRLSSKLRA